MPKPTDSYQSAKTLIWRSTLSTEMLEAPLLRFIKRMKFSFGVVKMTFSPAIEGRGVSVSFTFIQRSGNIDRRTVPDYDDPFEVSPKLAVPSFTVLSFRDKTKCNCLHGLP